MPPHLAHTLDEYLTGYIMASRRELLAGGESAACRRGHWDRWESGAKKSCEQGDSDEGSENCDLVPHLPIVRPGDLAAAAWRGRAGVGRELPQWELSQSRLGPRADEAGKEAETEGGVIGRPPAAGALPRAPAAVAPG